MVEEGKTMGFDKKTVLITGGSSGIGWSCARMLSKAGANVVILDRDKADLDELASIATHASSRDALLGDVTDPAAVRASVEKACQLGGALDIAINCAGVTGRLLPLVDQDDEALDALFSVNVRGVYLAMKYQLRQMLQTGRGSIVNVASIFGLRSAPNFVLYSATKHAVAGLTKGAALEMAKSGIRVNAVAPGPVNTPFLGRTLSDEERLSSPVTPMFRFAEPDEIARAILWLCSDEASFVTGTVLPVDGGLAAQSRDSSMPPAAPQ
jgi:NAD(P)-dependent dehydrogenase (short-subunit alcohol dehydrogenase family)